jgi:6-pyruvoyltetrahydropterin/6-carboxytetrahydropterin synthase
MQGGVKLEGRIIRKSITIRTQSVVLEKGIKMEKQTISRKFSFDSGHRVMNEKQKCFNLHGHTYICTIKLKFDNMREIGYPIDFKEIKRVGVQFVDDFFDHGVIVNPMDEAVIECAMKTGSKMWYMSLNGTGQYCNPTVENIAKELFLALDLLLRDQKYGLEMHSIKLYETPNCYTICKAGGIHPEERSNFFTQNFNRIAEFGSRLGVIDYDDRK